MISKPVKVEAWRHELTFCLSNSIWRPADKVTAWPLAVCDASSVDADDLVLCDIVRRRFVGETLFGKFNPRQRWCYLSGQEADEIAMLQIYDSDAERGALRCKFSTPATHHTGIHVCDH